jgi:hypothetical protein
LQTVFVIPDTGVDHKRQFASFPRFAKLDSTRALIAARKTGDRKMQKPNTQILPYQMEINQTIIGQLDILRTLENVRAFDPGAEWEIKGHFVWAVENRARQFGVLPLAYGDHGCTFMVNMNEREWDVNLHAFFEAVRLDLHEAFSHTSARLRHFCFAGLRGAASYGPVTLAWEDLHRTRCHVLGREAELVAILAQEAQSDRLVISSTLHEQKQVAEAEKELESSYKPSIGLS